jgi:hypothetical protein
VAPAPAASEAPVIELRRIKIPHRFTPRSYQVPVWEAYDRGIRRFMVVAHRRSGKDKNLLNFTIARAMERKGYYLHLMPFATQVRKSIWDGLGRDGMRFLDHFPPELISDKGVNQTEMSIELKNGSVWQCGGADRYDSFRSTNPVGIVLSEYATSDPRAWKTLAPILRENGGWMAAITTPNGRNHAYKMYSMAQARPASWFTQLLTIADTRRDAPGEDGLPIVTHDEYLEEIAQGADKEFCDQEYYCSFQGSTVGSYYGALLDRYKENVREVPFDPSLPVYTAWDIGLDDESCIFFVQLPHGPEGPIHVIDFERDRQKGITEYVSLVKSKPYSYGLHCFPHDAAMMISALEDLGMRPCISLSKTESVTNDIAHVRALIPRMFWNRSKAMDGHAALMNYHKEFNVQTGTYVDHPKHDWSSHAADAMRMLAVALVAGHLDDPESADRARYKTADNANWTGYSELDALHEARDDGDHEAEDTYQPWERSRFRY